MQKPVTLCIVLAGVLYLAWNAIACNPACEQAPSAHAISSQTFVDALRDADSAAVQRCIAAGLDLNKPVDKSVPKFGGQLPLEIVVHRGQLDMVELLVKNGANPSMRASDGWWIAAHSTGKDRERILALLTRPTPSGVEELHEEIVELLKKKIRKDKQIVMDCPQGFPPRFYELVKKAFPNAMAKLAAKEIKDQTGVHLGYEDGRGNVCASVVITLKKSSEESYDFSISLIERRAGWGIKGSMKLISGYWIVEIQSSWVS